MLRQELALWEQSGAGDEVEEEESDGDVIAAMRQRMDRGAQRQALAVSTKFILLHITRDDTVSAKHSESWHASC